jgi:hypothetical protein
MTAAVAKLTTTVEERNSGTLKQRPTWEDNIATDIGILKAMVLGPRDENKH